MDAEVSGTGLGIGDGLCVLGERILSPGLSGQGSVSLQN